MDKRELITSVAASALKRNSRAIFEDVKRSNAADAVRLKKLQKEEYDAYVEKTEQEWLVKLRNTELTEPEIMTSDLEVDKKQEWLGYVDKQLDEIKKDKEPVTNEEVKGRLESMAYDIWTGAVKMEDFLKELKTARYIDRTIDDAAYDEIFSLVQREHKTYQATAIKVAVDEAKIQLIDAPGDMDIFAAIEAAKAMFEGKELKKETERILSERQLQFWHHGQYRKALNQWFADHPDADADEIYIESRKLLSHYRRRGISEIERLLAEREKQLFTVSPDIEEMKEKYPEIWEAAGKAVGEVDISDIPEPKTRAEFTAQLSAIKGRGRALAYYTKWVDKLWP